MSPTSPGPLFCRKRLKNEGIASLKSLTFGPKDVPFDEGGEKWGDYPRPLFLRKACIASDSRRMASFKGQANFSVDSKGRVAIPAKMRAALRPEALGTFTMTRGFEQCIYVYPLDEWQKKEDQYSALNTYNREARHLVRTILMWADEVGLDGQGRISLSKPLAEYAGISDRALIIGAMDRIEIWNPDVFENYLEEQSDDHEALAERVMGS